MANRWQPGAAQKCWGWGQGGLALPSLHLGAMLGSILSGICARACHGPLLLFRSHVALVWLLRGEVRLPSAASAWSKSAHSLCFRFLRVLVRHPLGCERAHGLCCWCLRVPLWCPHDRARGGGLGIPFPLPRQGCGARLCGLGSFWSSLQHHSVHVDKRSCFSSRFAASEKDGRAGVSQVAATRFVTVPPRVPVPCWCSCCFSHVNSDPRSHWVHVLGACPCHAGVSVLGSALSLPVPCS